MLKPLLFEFSLLQGQCVECEYKVKATDVKSVRDSLFIYGIKGQNKKTQHTNIMCDSQNLCFVFFSPA